MRRINVLYEDNHIIAINKFSGALSQSDRTGDAPISDLVKRYIKEKYNKPGNVFLGTTHRLDRPVTGVLIFARTSKALTRLNQMFADKEISKTYWMVSQNKAPEIEDDLVHYLKKNTKRNISSVFDREVKSSKKAELHYILLSSIAKNNLYQVSLKTGRSHQIRAQMSHIGCPILGDLRYGAFKPLEDMSIALHCISLEFIHPVSKLVIHIKAPLPNNRVWEDFKTIEF